MFFNKFASCLIPYFDFLIGDGLALDFLKQFLMVHLYCVTSSFLFEITEQIIKLLKEKLTSINYQKLPFPAM